ncbi:hypothetical protein [Bosea thiooxidans]
MTASLSHHRPAHQAAQIASMVRMRLQQRVPPPLPRADVALLKAALGIMAAGVLATGIALFLTHRREEQPSVLQPARVGNVALMIPKELTGVEADDDASRLVGMARLRLDWPTLGPAQPQSRKRLLVTLSPPDKVNEPARQLATYARFLTPTVWSNPGGLVVRSFRKGSPFEGDEFYVSVPDGRGFAARCPVETAANLDEPCRITFQHRGMDVNVRFPRAIIANWAEMLGGVRHTIDRLIR